MMIKGLKLKLKEIKQKMFSNTTFWNKNISLITKYLQSSRISRLMLTDINWERSTWKKRGKSVNNHEWKNRIPIRVSLLTLNSLHKDTQTICLKSRPEDLQMIQIKSCLLPEISKRLPKEWETNKRPWKRFPNHWRNMMTQFWTKSCSWNLWKW